MAKRSRSNKKSRRKNGGGINLRVFIIVFVLIALVAFAITYLVMDQKENDARKTLKAVKQDVERPQSGDKKNDSVPMPKITFSGDEIKPGNLDGTWVSNNDGAMLTISGRDYSIELPNVDGTVVDKGTIVVLANEVKFVDTDEESPCTVSVGIYSYKVVNNVISFKKVKDECESRINRLSATWYKI